MKPNFSFEIHARMRGGFLFVEMQDFIIMQTIILILFFVVDGNNKSSYKQYDLLPFHCSAQSKAVFEEMRRSLRRVLHFLGKRYHWSPLIRRKLTLSLEDQRAGIVNVRF